MISLDRTQSALSLVVLAYLLTVSRAAEATWEVPFAGNAYVTGGEEQGTRASAKVRLQPWSTGERTLFFRVNGPAELDLTLRASVAEGKSRLRISAAGQVWEREVAGAEVTDIPLGRASVKEPGYVPVLLQGLQKTGPTFAEVQSIRLAASGPAVEFNYVRDDEARRFYWGRRGPSVHLHYTLPMGVETEWFYNEVTVPVGENPVGSYFMANGFGEGYFGLQVNSATERRVLFSVWSPFQTDRPQEIPADQKVTLLRKGEAVHGGDFGGEGAGGQTYLVFSWQAGHTYCFLNRVHPEEDGSTVYTAWFRPTESAEWQLIASLRRPHTSKHLTGAHSFLENFMDEQGALGRRVVFQNQWAVDTAGQWHELTQARLTGDDIAKRGFRLDYAGGLEGAGFYLRNGGFFAQPVQLGSVFHRESMPERKPRIDLRGLLD